MIVALIRTRFGGEKAELIERDQTGLPFVGIWYLVRFLSDNVQMYVEDGSIIAVWEE